MTQIFSFTSSNFFRVKNKADFLAFMNNVRGEKDITIKTRKNKDGITEFAFSSPGFIWGICDNPTNDYYSEDDPGLAYTAFIRRLQDLVDFDDSIIMKRVVISEEDDINGIVTIIKPDGCHSQHVF